MACRLPQMRFLFALLMTAVPGLPQVSVHWSVTTLAGSDWVGDQGPATQALLFQAEGVTTDSAGNLYIAEAQGHRVRQVSPQASSGPSPALDSLDSPETADRLTPRS